MYHRRFSVPFLLTILALFALWLAAGLFTNVLQVILLGTNPDPVLVARVHVFFWFATPCPLLVALIAVISLLMYASDAAKYRLKRRQLACPRCGMREAGGTLKFQRKVIKGTGWESLTCPQCGYSWHERS